MKVYEGGTVVGGGGGGGGGEEDGKNATSKSFLIYSVVNAITILSLSLSLYEDVLALAFISFCR